MKQAVTFNSYLFKILIISGLYLALPILFSMIDDLPTNMSYIRSVVCFFILLVVSVRLLLGRQYVRFYSIAFIILILLGLVHYLWLINPDYFNSDGSPIGSFWGEYHAVYNSVNRVINDRKDIGLLYFDKDAWEVTHPEIWQIISWPMTFLQNKWLNYSPLNVFSSLLASINMILLFNYTYSGREEKLGITRKIIMYVTAFFPMWLLNDTLWREATGIALISIGLTFVTLSDTVIKKTASFFIFAIVSFLQRTVYIVIAGAAFALRELQTRKAGIKIVLTPFFLLLMFFLIQYFNNAESEVYVSSYVKSVSAMALPIKIVLGFIGPFPWTQFSLALDGNINYAYQLSDYLLGTFQLGYLIAILANWKRFSLSNLDYMTIMGLGMMVAGLTTHMMHIGYIAEGVYFTLPWFFNRIGSSFWRYFFISLVFLVLLNIFVMIFSVSGISTIWK